MTWLVNGLGIALILGIVWFHWGPRSPPDPRKDDRAPDGATG